MLKVLPVLISVFSCLMLKAQPGVLNKMNKDTVIEYTIDGLSSEGSGVVAHYHQKSLVKSEWTIYGEMGKTIINYQFAGNKIIATETEYQYLKSLMQIESNKDMKIKTRLSYTMDKTGKLLTKISKKDFQNSYPDFAKVVPMKID